MVITVACTAMGFGTVWVHIVFMHCGAHLAVDVTWEATELAYYSFLLFGACDINDLKYSLLCINDITLVSTVHFIVVVGYSWSRVRFFDIVVWHLCIIGCFKIVHGKMFKSCFFGVSWSLCLISAGACVSSQNLFKNTLHTEKKIWLKIEFCKARLNPETYSLQYK